MDPNSRNQQWSQWSFIVRPERPVPFATLEDNVARFMRRVFGSAGRMKIDHQWSPLDGTTYLVVVQAEAANVNDPGKRAWVERWFLSFIRQGLGATTTATMEIGLLAGSPEDGKPADQWLIMPTVKERPMVWGDA